MIFPDTSARLLVYVVKPLFDYFYKQRNLFPPAIIFIRTPQHGKSPTLKEIDLFYQRVKEIKNKFNLQGEDKILVIDDVYYKGETFKLISQSFKNFDSNLRIEGFFFIKYDDNIAENCFYGIEEVGLNFDFLFYGEDHVGVDKTKTKKYVQKVSNFQSQYVASIRKNLNFIGKEFINSL